MSVARIERNLRKGKYAKRISTVGAVYMAAVLEYLTAEVLELSGYVAADNRRQRIVPRHIMLAIRNDAELNELLKDVEFPTAGVMPFPQQELLNMKLDNKKDNSKKVSVEVTSSVQNSSDSEN